MRQCLWNARNKQAPCGRFSHRSNTAQNASGPKTNKQLPEPLPVGSSASYHPWWWPWLFGEELHVLRKFIPVSQQMRILISWTENSMFWFKFIFLWLLCFLCFFFLKINIKYGLLKGNAEDWVAVVVGRLRGDSCEYKKHLEGLRCGGCLHRRLLGFARQTNGLENLIEPGFI